MSNNRSLTTHTYWQNALSGNFGAVHENDPQCGYYRMRKGRGGPWVPVAIWLEGQDDAGMKQNSINSDSGKLVCLVEGQRQLAKVLSIEFIKPMNLMQTERAKVMGVPRRRVNELCRNRHGITVQTSLILANVLGTTVDFWLNLKKRNDLWDAVHSTE